MAFKIYKPIALNNWFNSKFNIGDDIHHGAFSWKIIGKLYIPHFGFSKIKFIYAKSLSIKEIRGDYWLLTYKWNNLNHKLGLHEFSVNQYLLENKHEFYILLSCNNYIEYFSTIYFDENYKLNN